MTITVLLIGLSFSFISCDKQSINTTMRKIETEGLDENITEVAVSDAYPMYDPFYKVFETTKEYKEQNSKEDTEESAVKNKNKIDPKHIAAIYFPLVSEEEKNVFYEKRFGEARALNVKVIVRMENFDKRLYTNRNWYPHINGVTIKGKVNEVPEEILNAFKKEEQRDIPSLKLNKDTILIEATTLIPEEETSYTIKLGAVIEDKSYISAEDIKKGLEMGNNYMFETKGEIYNRPFEMIIKEVNNKEEAKQALSELYEEEKTPIALSFTSNETAKSLVPIAKKYEKLLFIENAYLNETIKENWNKYVFKLSPNIYQRAKALAQVISDDKAKAIIVTQKNNIGETAFEAIGSTIEENGGEIVKHIEIDSNDIKDYPFNELKGIGELDASHLIVFWDINEKNPEEAINYSPVSILVKDEWKNEIKGLQVVFEIPSMEVLNTLKGGDGFIGSTYYHHKLADYAMNDVIIEKKENENIEPSHNLCKGFLGTAVTLSIIKSSYGNFDVINLLQFIEGKEFETPKGFINIRKIDHISLQSMYKAKLSYNPDTQLHSIEALGTMPRIREIYLKPPVLITE